jgi:hypothetical protein
MWSLEAASWLDIEKIVRILDGVSSFPYTLGCVAGVIGGGNLVDVRGGEGRGDLGVMSVHNWHRALLRQQA